MKRKSVVVAALVALGTCVSTVAPAAGAPPAASPSEEGVRTVFIGDSYTSNFGIAPTRPSAPELCFRATENYPAVAARTLAEEGVPLDVRADVSCGGAEIHHVWEEQRPAVGPQENALREEDPQLVVGSMGGNTVGFVQIMKQCSTRLRGIEGAILPVGPVNKWSPAYRCADFFQKGKGAAWLDGRFKKVEDDLDTMFTRIDEAAPGAETVLVGYPRIVPEDTEKCREYLPGTRQKPLADITQKSLKWLDKEVQQPLNALMERKAQEAGATFVDVYGQSGTHTACDGAQRGIGGMLERSEVTYAGVRLPWFVHPNRTGRDLQAELVAEAVKNLETA